MEPGIQPKTRLAKQTTLESGRETILYEEDLQNIDKKGWPIVVAYNGRDHYAPTLVINSETYGAWQLACVAKLSKATLQVVRDVDVNNIDDEKKDFLGDFQKTLRKAITMFAPSSDPIDTPTGGARSVYFGSLPSSAPLVPDTSGEPSSSAVPAVPAKVKGRKIRSCAHCDYETDRSTDLRNHIAFVHGIGVEHLCVEGICQTKNEGKGNIFFNKRSLNQHIDNVHKGIYKFMCKEPDCKFRSNSQTPFTAHMAKKHGIGVEEHICEDCSKVFVSKLYLQKHQRSGMCKIPKNFQCEDCGKWFKTKEKLEEHEKVFHTQEIDKVICEECGKEYASEKGLQDHMIIHRGLEALQTSQRRRAATATTGTPEDSVPAKVPKK